MIKLKPSFEEIANTLTPTDFPIDVLIETIAYCNLRCSMCPQKTIKRPKGEMDFDVFSKIADEIAEVSPTTRVWLAIMGEPLLLRDKIIKMIHYAKRKGIEEIHFNTNANLMDNEMAEKLVDAGVDVMYMGLDAFTRETYDKIRVGGDFTQTVKNIEKMLEIRKRRGIKKPNIVTQFILMAENKHEFEDFKNFWLSRGAIVKVRRKTGWGTAIEAEYDEYDESKRTFPCPVLVREAALLWDGRFVHCSCSDFEGSYSPGDVRHQTIREVWNGELAKRRNRHWAGDFSHDLCRNCRDWQMGLSRFFYPDGNDI